MSTGATNPPFAQPVNRPYRWVLGLMMMVVITIGWRFPYLGFMVPLSMLVGMAGGPFRGRYACGNLCPRGSFYDTFFRFVGGIRPVPLLFNNSTFRWAIFALLIGLMVLQLSRNPTDPLHWGRVFWLICAVTTAVGIVLGLIFRARTWCAFCPIGTFAMAVGGEKYTLQVGENCKSCRTCEQHCPMGLTIAAYKESGVMPHPDCLKCSSCVEACPSKALCWPGGS